MRSLGGFGVVLAAGAAGLALTACGTAANQAGTPHPASSTQAVSRAHSAARASTEALAAGQPAARATTPTPAATITPVPSPSPSAPAPARYGNPSGSATVPAAGRAVSTRHPNHVIGSGSPAGCTSAAVVRAVAKGGIITFNCGPKPVTITMTATAKVVNTHHRTVLDGGGKVTLSGGGKIRILYMNTCDPKQIYTTSDCWEQKWPQLVVQNIAFTDAYSSVRQTSTSAYGGGAIFDEGGQLKVVNSGFFSNRCYATGPDLGGAAIRALGMWPGRPVYVTSDTFRGGRCSNGGALSSIDASWDVFNSLMSENKTTGNGENPAASGTPGGGSGGAIYTDGDNYSVTIAGTVIHYNDAHGGEGGAVFFVVDAGAGRLLIEEHSALHHNPSGGYVNAPGIFDDVDQKVVQPTIIDSTDN